MLAPSPDTVGWRLQAGALWNRFVIIGRVASLVALGRQLAARTHSELAWASRSLGTGDEERALDQAYANFSDGDFSRAILEQAAPRLAVSPLPALTWTDLGTAPRVDRLLSKLALIRHSPQRAGSIGLKFGRGARSVHRRTQDVILGNVAQGVLRRAQVPCMLIPPGVRHRKRLGTPEGRRAQP